MLCASVVVLFCIYYVYQATSNQPVTYSNQSFQLGSNQTETNSTDNFQLTLNQTDMNSTNNYQLIANFTTPPKRLSWWDYGVKMKPNQTGDESDIVTCDEYENVYIKVRAKSNLDQEGPKVTALTTRLITVDVNTKDLGATANSQIISLFARLMEIEENLFTVSKGENEEYKEFNVSRKCKLNPPEVLVPLVEENTHNEYFKDVPPDELKKLLKD